MKIKIIKNNKYPDTFTQGTLVTDDRYIILVATPNESIDSNKFNGVVIKDDCKMVNPGYYSSWYKKDFNLFLDKIEIEND